MSQPTICIGTLGHVANGKSSLVRELTQKATQRFKMEKLTNRTIKIGYANCKIFKCRCVDPYCYKSYPEVETSPYCDECGEFAVLQKYVSFIDSPGHNSFMLTMLGGVCNIDSAILVFGANNTQFPAPQTQIHLDVTRLLDVKDPIVALNKIDLVDKVTARERLKVINDTIKGTKFEGSPVIPISANLGVGVNYICKHIANLKDRETQEVDNCVMLVVSSFNINKQGQTIDTLKGGVVGGSIMLGSLKKGDDVTILPGVVKNSLKEMSYRPLEGTVVSMKTESRELDKAVVGGLIAVELSIDPSFATQDGLIGSVLYTKSNNGYSVLRQVSLTKYVSLSKVVLKKDDIVTLTCLSRSSRCRVRSAKDNVIKLECQNSPIIAKHDMRVVISKEHKGEVVVVGFGEVEHGVLCKEAN